MTVVEFPIDCPGCGKTHYVRCENREGHEDSHLEESNE